MKRRIVLLISSLCVVFFIGMSCTKAGGGAAPELRIDPMLEKLSAMQTLYDTSKVGLEDGTYPASAKDDLLKAIDDLRKGISKAKAGEFVLQFEVDNYVIAAEKATNAFLNTLQITLPAGTLAELTVFGTDKKGYIDFGESAEYSSSNKWSVETWIKYEAGFNEAPMGDFISTFNSQSDGQIVGWSVNFLGGNLRTTIGMGPQSGRVLEYGSPQPENYGAWNHIVAVYDGTAASDQLKMYLNGKLFWSKTNDIKNGSGVLQNYAPNVKDLRMWAFQRPANPECCITGTIKKFRLWSVSKTESEINALMNTDVVGTEAGLVCAWDFTAVPEDIKNIPDKTGRHKAKVVGTYKWKAL